MTNTEAKRTQRRIDAVEAIVLRQEPAHLVARVFNIPNRTLFKWLARYRSGGWHALRESKRTGRPHKLSAENMEWIYRAVTLGNPTQYQFDFCLWTLNTLRSLILKELKVKLSKSSLSRLLDNLGLTAQRPIFKSYKQDPKKMEDYLNKTFPEAVAEAKKRGATLYFVDEASIRSDSHRGTTWGIEGHTPVVRDSGGRFTLNVISAVSPRGDMRFSYITDTMNAVRFCEFLAKLYKDNGKPILVIVDNARYHHAKETQKFIEEQKGSIQLTFLPAYSPELNPDEQVWNHAKRIIGTRPLFSKDDMKRALDSALRSIQRKKNLIQSFFRMEQTRYILEAVDAA